MEARNTKILQAKIQRPLKYASERPNLRQYHPTSPTHRHDSIPISVAALLARRRLPMLSGSRSHVGALSESLAATMTPPLASLGPVSFPWYAFARQARMSRTEMT